MSHNNNIIELLYSLPPVMAKQFLAVIERQIVIEKELIWEMRRQAAADSSQLPPVPAPSPEAVVLDAKRAAALSEWDSILDDIQLYVLTIRGFVTTRTTPSQRFTVTEHLNGFRLYDTQMRRQKQAPWLGSGVGVLEDPESPGEFLPPGGIQFCKAWAARFNANITETLETYFPEEGG